MNEVKTEKKRAGAGGDGEKIAASPTDQVHESETYAGRNTKERENRRKPN